MSRPPKFVVSHWSAANRFGLPLLRGFTRPARTVPPHSAGHRGRGYVPFWSPCPAEHLQLLEGARVTTVLRTLLDCGMVLPLYDAVAMMDAALHSGRVTLTALRQASATATGPGSGRARCAVALADGRAMSPQESIGRLAFALLGITARPQGRIEGYWHAFDLLLDRVTLAVEQQSKTHHTEWADRKKDMGHFNEISRRRRWQVVLTEPADAWPSPDRFVEKVLEVAVCQPGATARSWRRRFVGGGGRVELSGADRARVLRGCQWPPAARRWVDTTLLPRINAAPSAVFGAGSPIDPS